MATRESWQLGRYQATACKRAGGIQGRDTWSHSTLLCRVSQDGLRSVPKHSTRQKRDEPLPCSGAGWIKPGKMLLELTPC